MARSRNIKPSIMDNEELAELEPLTRILFIYLWMLADREGRLEDRPKRIAARALPYDRSADVDYMLNDLQKSGFIVRYEAQGVACIYITAFAKHQTPHVREADSELPEYVEVTAKVVTKHCQGSAEASPRSPDSLIPDSLIPDSLIPDSLIPDNGAKRRSTKVQKPDSVEQQTWDDFLELRKTKKAPVSHSAITRIANEAQKADMSLGEALEIMCSRGWTGFKAEWVANQPVKQSESFAEHDARLAREKAQKWAPYAAEQDPYAPFVTVKEVINVPAIECD